MFVKHPAPRFIGQRSRLTLMSSACALMRTKHEYCWYLLEIKCYRQVCGQTDTQTNRRKKPCPIHSTLIWNVNNKFYCSVTKGKFCVTQKTKTKHQLHKSIYLFPFVLQIPQHLVTVKGSVTKKCVLKILFE